MLTRVNFSRAGGVTSRHLSPPCPVSQTRPSSVPAQMMFLSTVDGAIENTVA
jgi:hypothetical protein